MNFANKVHIKQRKTSPSLSTGPVFRRLPSSGAFMTLSCVGGAPGTGKLRKFRAESRS